MRHLFTTRAVHWFALLFLCAAYLQGCFNKATDFPSAVAEMNHFGISPAEPMAMAVIVLEFSATLMILTGFYRWLGALGLAGFTLMATFVANRFWEMGMPERFTVANSFFEHFGLVGAFLLVAWHDLLQPDAQPRQSKVVALKRPATFPCYRYEAVKAATRPEQFGNSSRD